MQIFRAKLEKLVSDLPTKKPPKDAYELADDREYALSLYSKKMQKRFNEIIASDNTNNDWSEWLSSVGGLQYNDKYDLYTGDNAIYAFTCNYRIKSDKTKFIKELVKQMLSGISKNLNAGLRIGLIVWSHNTVIEFKVKTALFNLLTRDRDLTQQHFIEFYNHRHTIGTTLMVQHLKKHKREKTIPVQTFFCETDGIDDLPRSFESRSKRVKSTAKFMKAHKNPLYIHSSFFHNLCTPKMNMKDLLADLRDGAKIGARGVVIHVGKNVDDKPYEVAVARMLLNIRLILKHVKENCPLLIENPAGQGSEILSNKDDFIKFYSNFTDDEKKLVKICFDTCHSDASGDEPLDFMIKLEETHPKCIRFVHFNDSKGPRGCKVDRHFGAGGGLEIVKRAVEEGKLPKSDIVGKLGYIGLKRMTEIAKWCNDKEIHMVTESA